MLNYQYRTLEFLKICIHALSSDQSSGYHELLTAQNTRSRRGIMAAIDHPR